MFNEIAESVLSGKTSSAPRYFPPQSEIGEIERYHQQCREKWKERQKNRCLLQKSM